MVDSLDLSAIEASYEGSGASSYNPRMLTKVVFYAYLQNVYSGRKMASVLDAERNGRRLSPPMDVPPAARKRVPTSAACGSKA